ncbi:MAG: GPW/gp25 family protein [Immundisolibacter sp.]|nr:GPW/gp25 family protein [Immundisolibacter sp.]MDD3652325.1 GPW/gp25 family protein [Immundisolibacter sp.]
MSATTGRALTGLDHLRQSIRDILTTRIGTRVMRRDYGSHVPDLIDHPGNPANKLRLQAAIVAALVRWEPRLSLTRCTISVDLGGRASVTFEGTRLDSPRTLQPVTITERLA